MTIVLGTRPEAIKLAPVIQAFQRSGDFRTRVVLTGQHREMVEQVMALFGLVADHDLALMAPKQTLTHITCGALQGLKEEFTDHRPDLVLVCPLHANPNVRPVLAAHLAGRANAIILDPLDYPNFVRLLAMSTLVLTDSGGIQEEAPAFGKPVLVLRHTTERPEGLVAGTAKLVGTDTDRIVAEATALLDDPVLYRAMARAHNPFGDGRAAERIAAILAAAAKF